MKQVDNYRQRYDGKQKLTDTYQKIIMKHSVVCFISLTWSTMLKTANHLPGKKKTGVYCMSVFCVMVYMHLAEL